MVSRDNYHGHAREWKLSSQHVVSEAWATRQHAVNHRDFCMAAAARIVHRPNPNQLLTDTLVGYNYMPTPSRDCKMCAERLIFSQVRGFTRAVIIGMCIVGPFQVDDTAGIAIKKTTAPCLACRIEIRSLVAAGLMRLQTEIIAIRVDDSGAEELKASYTVDELIRKYSNDPRTEFARTG